MIVSGSVEETKFRGSGYGSTVATTRAAYASTLVATRFVTYGVSLDSDAQDYVTALLELAAMQEWAEAAKREPWIIPECEV